jgi:hypothetical protein
MPYFREENPNHSRPRIKDNKGPPTSRIYLDEISEEGSSLANDNEMDPSEVKGDDLLVLQPTL